MPEDTEDLNDHCANCGDIIGLKDHSDDPGNRWKCGACEQEYCAKCYGRDNPFAPLNHTCAGSPLTEEHVQDRYGVGAGGTINNRPARR